MFKAVVTQNFLQTLFKSYESFILKCLIIAMPFYIMALAPFSPIYIINILLLPLVLYVTFQNRSIYFPHDVLILCLLVAYISITKFDKFYTGTYVNLFFGFIAYFFIRTSKNQFSSENLLHIFRFALKVVLFALVADTLYRFIFPAKVISADFFYAYKLNSLLFAGSNSSGLIALVFYFSVRYLEKIKNIKLHFFRYSMLLLLILSVSRAAIMAFVAGELFIYFLGLKKTRSRIAVFTILVPILAGFSYFLFSEDSSLLTRFKIIGLFFDYLSNLTIKEFFFGVGLHSSKEIFGMSAHLLFINYFVETGIVSFLLFVTFFFYYWFRISGIVLLPVFVVSLSYFLYLGAPFLFIPLAILANLKELENSDKGELLVKSIAN